MTWRTILAAAVFIGMCGFIAYWGDLLGRRLGKRRLSLFGLRPRYTAIIFTTITGMLIAVFTISFMAAISQRVRLLMLEGDKIISERKVILRKYEVAQRAADEARAGALQAKADARIAIQQRDTLVREVNRISVSLQQSRLKLLRNEAALDRTEKLLAAANSRLRSSSIEIEERKGEISAQRAEIVGLEEQRTDLSNQIERLSAEMGEAVLKYQRYIALRQRTVILRSNEELARTIIDCTQPEPSLRTEVLRVLDAADRNARERGARTGDNGRAVRIITKKITGPEGSAEQTVTEGASINALVGELSSGSGSVVLRVISIGNSVEGEQVLVEFVPNYNRLIYWKGQNVSETQMDGSVSEGSILGQVISFLRSEVRPAAISKGIIPYYDEEQDQPTVGTISPDQLLEIVRHVKSRGKPVQVRAVAQADTWSAGPLDLDFRIEDR